MSTDEKKVLVWRNFEEVIKKKNLLASDDALAPEFIDHSPPHEHRLVPKQRNEVSSSSSLSVDLAGAGPAQLVLHHRHSRLNGEKRFGTGYSSSSVRFYSPQVDCGSTNSSRVGNKGPPNNERKLSARSCPDASSPE